MYQEARALRPSKWQSQRSWLTLVVGGCNAVWGQDEVSTGSLQQENPRIHGEDIQGVGEGCPNDVCGDRERRASLLHSLTPHIEHQLKRLLILF